MALKKRHGVDRSRKEQETGKGRLCGVNICVIMVGATTGCAHDMRPRGEKDETDKPVVKQAGTRSVQNVFGKQLNRTKPKQKRKRS